MKPNEATIELAFDAAEKATEYDLSNMDFQTMLPPWLLLIASGFVAIYFRGIPSEDIVVNSVSALFSAYVLVVISAVAHRIILQRIRFTYTRWAIEIQVARIYSKTHPKEVIEFFIKRSPTTYVEGIIEGELHSHLGIGERVAKHRSVLLILYPLLILATATSIGAFATVIFEIFPASKMIPWLLG